MASFSVLESMAKDLTSAGFLLVERSIADQKAITQRYEQAAKVASPKADVFRLGRTNAAGVLQADGGHLKFGRDGQKLICPKDLVADLSQNGYHLFRVEILRQEGDLDEKDRQRIRFRLYWTSGDEPKLELTDPQKKVARDFFNGSYHKLWSFFNASAAPGRPMQGSSVTLNFSGVMKAEQAKELADEIRDLRLIDHDHFRCVPRSTKSQVEDWHPGDTESVVNAAFGGRKPRQHCPNWPSPHHRQNPGGDVPNIDISESGTGSGIPGGHSFH